MKTAVQGVLQLALREQLLFSWVARNVTGMSVGALRCVVWPVTAVSALKERKTVSPVTNPLLLLTAGELARRIRTKQVSCSEVVAAYIARVQEVNPLVNAVVQDRFEAALKDAALVDALLASGQYSEAELEANKPLLGVPLTVKETIAVKGMSNNGAFSLVESHIAEEDADIIRLLKAAGAIPILVSNTPELCMSWETFNPRVGTTNNPYDTRRTPAGSSGGEAALLGSGASVIGVGSDICGSLRLPAMFCCVYGHKPTPGYVSNKGHRPSSDDESWDRFFTLGPMCRFATDLPIMLRTLVNDSYKIQELRLDEEVDISRLKVFYMEDDGPDKGYTDPINPEIKFAMRRAVTYLQDKYGIQATKANIQGLTGIVNYATFIMARMKGIPNVFQKDEAKPDEWNSVFSTFAKRLVGQSSSSLSCLMYAPLKTLVDNVPQEDYEIMLKKKEHIMNQFKELLGDNGVFLYPAFPQAAHFHGQIFYKFLNTAYLSAFNVLELPATAVPLGLNREGLPIGIQVSAWQRQDRLTMAVAAALEKEFGGWIPPSQTKR
ncbi:fatty-acid amide hydrolase 2-A-like isoform X1 [Macrosteles quadrilineatus]|uniref:fatty-acid amide hydrolase 2-A-like isoform X1 n=1 Tax=Macrosteles quadrilineatus TaxID=74068 RepID=UPI0023E26CE9|nr:fatty-acid amide hydrolase 2-A-like isoform X1 [Macrosteles quadrilineatus]